MWVKMLDVRDGDVRGVREDVRMNLLWEKIFLKKYERDVREDVKKDEQMTEDVREDVKMSRCEG